MEHGSDTRALLLTKEQELNLLREQTLQQLEQRLASREAQLEEMQSQFNQLRTDFEYNLSLLAERDAELQQYDADAAIHAASASDREAQLMELQAAYQEVAAELKRERTARQDDEFVAQAKRLELQKALEDQQAAGNEALLRAQEQHEQAKRALQRSLAEAEEELARQRREMGASFSMQVQQLELSYRQQAEDARQEAEIAKALAAQREDEARAAHARELQQIKAAESAVAEARRHEQNAKALSWELDNTRKLKDDTISELTQQNTQLKHQLKMRLEEADSVHTDLSTRLAAVTTQLEDMRTSNTAAADLARVQHEEEVAMLRQKLEQAQGKVESLGAEVSELQSVLKLSQRELKDKVTAAEAARRELVEKCTKEVVAVERAKGSELRETREALWAKEEEARVLRDKLDALRHTLDERRADLNAYKDQLLAAGEREREMQRRLMLAELRLEETGGEQGQRPDQERVVRKLLEQRDTANAALQDAQLRLIDKEAELSALRDRVVALSPRRGPATVAAAAALSAAAAAASGTQGSGSGGDRRGMGGGGGGAGGSQAQGGGGVRPAGVSRLSPLRPPELTLPGPGMVQAQDSQSSLPEMGDLSPLGFDLGIPSPRSSASFWAGILTGPRSSGGAATAAAAAASAAAARAAHFLRTSKEGLEAMLQQQGAAGLMRALDAAASPAGTTPGAEHSALRSALEQVQGQNAQLRATLSVMREEMEALQQAAAVAAEVASAPPAAPAVPLPEDVMLLRAELQESDRDLHQALEHIQVLQRQLDSGRNAPTFTATPGHRQQQAYPQGAPAGATDSGFDSPQDEDEARSGSLHIGAGFSGRADASSELSYLRMRVQALAAENRQLRRLALQLRLAAGERAAGALQAGSQSGNAAAAGGATSRAGVASNAQGMAIPGAGPSSSGVGDAQVSAGQHAAAIREAGRLRSENEKLMEMSNALRAERDRLAARLAAMAATVSGAGGTNSLHSVDSSEEEPRSPHHHPISSLHPSAYELAAAAALYGPAVLGAMAATAAGFAAHAPQLQHPFAWQGAQGPAVQGMAVAQGGGMAAAGSQQLLQQPGQLPGSPTAGPSPPRTADASSLSSHLASAPYTLAPKQASTQPSTSQSYPGAQPGQGAGVQHVSKAGGWSVSSTQGFHQTFQAHPHGVSIGQATGTMPGSEPDLDASGHRQQPNSPRGRDGSRSPGQCTGSPGPHPSNLPGSATSRETASQRARLKALQRKRELSSQPQLVVEGSQKPRVRNYNVRDDGDWEVQGHATLRAMMEGQGPREGEGEETVGSGSGEGCGGDTHT